MWELRELTTTGRIQGSLELLEELAAVTLKE